MTLRTDLEKIWEAGRKMETLEKRAARKNWAWMSPSLTRTCSERSRRTGEKAYLHKVAMTMLLLSKILLTTIDIPFFCHHLVYLLYYNTLISSLHLAYRTSVAATTRTA